MASTEQASGLFSQHVPFQVLEHLLVQTQVGHLLLQLAVLLFQDPQPTNLGHPHPLELLIPAPKGLEYKVCSLGHTPFSVPAIMRVLHTRAVPGCTSLEYAVLFFWRAFSLPCLIQRASL